MDFLLVLADAGASEITVNPVDALVYYGVAAPFIGYLVYESRRKDRALEAKDKALDDERARSAKLGQEQLEQALEMAPLMVQVVDALKRTARILARREADDVA